MRVPEWRRSRLRAAKGSSDQKRDKRNMIVTATRSGDGRDTDLWRLLRAIATGDSAKASHVLGAFPRLALEPSPIGATRASSKPYYFKEIEHYVYAGDTALHVAAAAYRTDIAKELVSHGADVSARNRRGAQPIHYASIGQPGSETWAPRAQAAIVAYLLRAGADPNAADKSGVTPLHRAVRTRCAAAVGTVTPSRRTGRAGRSWPTSWAWPRGRS